MEPMEPMEPMAPAPRWWPEALGAAGTSGGQDGFDYAFFPGKHRLAVRRNGEVTVFDSGDHDITGVTQDGGAPRFTSQEGTLDLHALKAVS